MTKIIPASGIAARTKARFVGISPKRGVRVGDAVPMLQRGRISYS